MTTQTRRTTRQSAKFLRTTIKVHMVVACCGLVLWSAVSTYAASAVNGLHVNGLTENGISTNGISTNGLTDNGISMNGISTNGISTNGEPPPAVQGKSLPFYGLSQKALGKPQPHRLDLLSLCSSYRLVPLCL